MGFPEQLSKRMKQLGITQRELAGRSGLALPSIGKYVRDQVKPNYRAIVSLAEALDVHPIWFFEDISLKEMQEIQEQLKGKSKPAIDSSSLELEPGTLVIGHWLPMRHLPSPFQGHSMGIAAQLYALVFSTLLQWRYTQVQADLAIDWKQVEKGWLFQLRPGARFHDGTALTGEDVRWSYEQYLQHNPNEANLLGVEVLDQSIAILHTRRNRPLSDIWMAPILRSGDQGMEELVGTGAYQLIEKQARMWRLRANPHYYQTKPSLKELAIQEYDGKEALEQALLGGEVHYARGVYVPESGFVPEVEPTFDRYQLHFMMNEPLMQDRKLRQAIASGLDREALAEAVGLKSPLYSSGAFDTVLGDPSNTRHQADTEQAKKLLKQKPAIGQQHIYVVCHPQLPAYLNLAEAVCEQLGQLGFVASMVQAGQPAHIMLTTRPVGVAQVEMRHWLSNDRMNLAGYSNPAVDHLIGQIAGDHPSSTQLRELRQHIEQDIPDIPLFYDEMPITYVDRLQVEGENMPSLNHLSEIHNWHLQPEASKEKEG